VLCLKPDNIFRKSKVKKIREVDVLRNYLSTIYIKNPKYLTDSPTTVSSTEDDTSGAQKSCVNTDGNASDGQKPAPTDASKLTAATNAKCTKITKSKTTNNYPPYPVKAG
jgi:hypothetical protein